MTALEGSSALAAIVGLIFNWMQVRDAAAEDQYQAFLLWLDNHHFQDLRSKITANGDLQRELNQLLREDTKTLSAKLDVVCDGISSLSQRIDRLGAVASVLETEGSSLSDQAIAILKLFNELGAARMVTFDPHPEMDHLLFLPIRRFYRLGDVRFMEDDLNSLCRFDFIRQVDANKSGNPIYALTRNGAKYVSQMVSDTVVQPTFSPEQPLCTLI